MQADAPSTVPQVETIRVLLVEDDPDDVFLLRETLADVSSPEVRFDVTHADRLAPALEMLRGAQFEVVLLDLSLPDSSGFETFGAVRAAGPDIAVVVLTGLDDASLALKAVQEGAQDYLVKGRADGELLSRSIRYAVERQRNSHLGAVVVERQRFDAAVSQMSDGIVVTDGNWRLTTANRAACRLLNLPEDGWQQLPLSEVLRAFDLSEDLRELLESADSEADFDLRRAGAGPRLVVGARLTRLTDGHGHLVSGVLVLRDVTAERLNAKLTADFLTMVPHKVRTPLTVLIGYLGLCKKLPPERLLEEYPELIDTCEHEARALSDLLQMLLEFRDLEQTDAAQGTSKVAEVVAATAEGIRGRYPDRDIEIVNEVDPVSGQVAAAPTHLGFVLHLLFDNAVKFSEGDSVKITVRSQTHGQAWHEVSIADDGPGIPHEYHDRVFDDFVQVEELTTGKVPGLGIGLPLAKRTVEAYGGSVSIESELGQGSTVRLSFPASSEAEARPAPR